MFAEGVDIVDTLREWPVEICVAESEKFLDGLEMSGAPRRIRPSVSTRLRVRPHAMGAEGGRRNETRATEDAAGDNRCLEVRNCGECGSRVANDGFVGEKPVKAAERPVLMLPPFEAVVGRLPERP